MAFNFLAQAASPGRARLRACVLASPSSAGSLTGLSPTLQQSIAGPDAARTFLGPGTPGYLAIKAIFAEHPLATVDLINVAPGGGVAASAVLTFDDTTPITSAQTVTITLCGREVSIAWLVGETKVQAASKLVAAVLSIDDDIAYTPTNVSGTSEAVTFTAKFAGTWGNDGQLFATITGGTGGAIALSGMSGANFTLGTTEMNIATALTAISGQEYTYIQLCTSNADAQAASASSNPGKLRAHIIAYGSGMTAHLQQGVVGATGLNSTIKNGTAVHNFGQMQYLFCMMGQSLPAEWGGAEIGARLREVDLNPVKNRIRMVYRATLYGPKDMVADVLTATENEDLLFAGVTPVSFTATGQPRPDRPITTYFKDTAGNADDRILDTSRVDGIFAVAADLRTSLPQTFEGMGLSPDLVDGDDEIPPQIVEVREVRAHVIQRCSYWANKRGVLDRVALAKAIGTPTNPGGLIVQVDETDEAQCDIVLPLKTVRPLAKFSLVVQQVQ